VYLNDFCQYDFGYSIELQRGNRNFEVRRQTMFLPTMTSIKVEVQIIFRATKPQTLNKYIIILDDH